MRPKSLPVLLTVVLVSALTGGCSPKAPAAGLEAIAAGILAAAEEADLVCLGETHGSLADAALRQALVGHPGFPSTFDVIVLESVSGIHRGCRLRKLRRQSVEGR